MRQQMSAAGVIHASLKLGKLSVGTAQDFIHILDADLERASERVGGALDDVALFLTG